MKIPDELLDELILEIAGESVIPLVHRLKLKDNISEFKLADDLGVGINEVRTMLYKLTAQNLVSFTRKKDKKKGWYVYYWTLDLKRSRDLILKLKKDKLHELRNILTSQSRDYYFLCQNNCCRMSFESAMEHDFKCPECGSVLIQENSEQLIVRIKRQIVRFSEEIDIISAVKGPEVVEEEPKKKVKKKAKGVKKKVTKKKVKPKKKVQSKKKVKKKK